jgi:hypothetical protein
MFDDGLGSLMMTNDDALLGKDEARDKRRPFFPLLLIYLRDDKLITVSSTCVA